MNHRWFRSAVHAAVLFLALPPWTAMAQIAPGAPAKEYIRLADRLVAIEHLSQPGSLPGGLSSTPVNSACSLNSATYGNGLFTVAGTGGGLINTIDSFEFASVPITGDVTLITRIPASLTGPATWNVAAGLMLRTDLSASAPYALMGIGRESVYQGILPMFRKRTTQGGSPASSYVPAAQAFYPPYWFKLERVGSTISGYHSSNGIDWTALGSPLTGITAPTIYAGLAVANYTTSCTPPLLTAAFDHFVMSAGPDFYLTTTPATVSSSGAGETNTYTIGVNPVQGFASPVSFTVAGLPAGASWMFTPATVTPAGSTILTVTAPPDMPPGSYPFTIHSSGGGKTHTDYATFTAATSAGGLASGWTAANVASTSCSINSASYSNGAFTLSSTGNLTASNDSFEFVYAPVRGDVTLIARVPAPLTGYLAVLSAGLMLRTGLSVYDKYALVGIGSPIAHWQKTLFRKRAVTQQAPSSEWGGMVYYSGLYYGPYWFKLVRSGSTIAGYASINGVDWTAVGTPLTGITQETLYAGFAVASGDATCGTPYQTTASFDNAALWGGTGGGSPDFSIGVPSSVLSVNAGGALNLTTIVTASGGFSEDVEFSVSELPAGSVGTFSPPTIGGQGTSNLAISTSASLTLPGSYSPLVTGDSTSLSRSAIATFAVDPPQTQPPSVAISPASGSGTAQTFTLTATEPEGVANIQWLQFLINESFGALRGCYVHYDVSSNELYLRDDVDPSWAASRQLGTAGTIANTQCSVNTGTSSYSSGGTTATLNLAVTFKAAFAGDKQTYGLVDSGNWNSGWGTPGSWTVLAPAGSLPSGWTLSSINNTCSLNTASFSSGVFSVTSVNGVLASSTNPDSLLFPSIPTSGDVTIVGRIASGPTGYVGHLNNGGVGFLLRKGPAALSSYAFIGVSRTAAGNQAMFRGRATDDGPSTTPVFGPSVTAPYWFKLVRSGTTITGYYSSDGAAWTSLGSIVISSATTMHAGLAIIEGIGNTTCSPTYSLSATFDNVAITNP